MRLNKSRGKWIQEMLAAIRLKYCWSMCSGTWHCAAGWGAPDISQKHSAFNILRIIHPLTGHHIPEEMNPHTEYHQNVKWHIKCSCHCVCLLLNDISIQITVELPFLRSWHVPTLREEPNYSRWQQNAQEVRWIFRTFHTPDLHKLWCYIWHSVDHAS
jgi:hypothetical protein